MYASSSGQMGEFLMVVRKRKWQILLPTTFVFCLGLAVAILIPRKYHAEAGFELRYVRMEDNRKDPERTSTALEVQNADLHLTNFERVRAVIDELGWEDYANLKRPTDRAEYLKRQLDSIEVVKNIRDKNKTGSAFITVYYKNVDRDRSTRFLRALIKSWSTELVERDEALLSAERDQLQNNSALRKRSYQDALDDVERIEKKLGILSWTGTGTATATRNEDPYIQELTQVNTDLTRANAQYEGARSKLEQLRKRIDVELDTEVVDEKSGQSDVANEIRRLETEINGLRTQQQGLTTRHSQWQRLQSEIEGRDAQLERLQALPQEVIRRQVERPNLKKKQLIEDADDVSVLVAELEGRTSKLEERKQELSDIQAERLSLRRQLTEANSRVELTQQLYQESALLLQRKDDALNDLIRANAQPFVWSQQPIAPEDPTEPNPILIVAIGLAAGLALGLGSSMLVEFTKSCYRSVSDVTAVMTLPVLGVVSQIVTSPERRAARMRGAVVVSSSAVMLAVVGWFTWAYTQRPDILPTEFIQQIEEIRANFK